MPNIPGNPAIYPTNIRAPGGTDPRNATTEDAAFQDLADRTAYLASKVGGPLSTVGVWYPIPIGLPGTVTNPPEWQIYNAIAADQNHPVLGYRTADGASLTVAHYLDIPLSPFLPPTGVLRDIEIDLYGDPNRTTMPETMPSASLYNYDPDTLAYTLLAGDGTAQPIFDTASLPEYIVRHSMGQPGLSGGTYTIIDLSLFRGLHFLVKSESGTGAANQTMYFNPRALVARSGY